MGPRLVMLAMIGLVIALAFGACGPAVYVSEVTRGATSSIDKARAARADKYAPYYWTRAMQYLHQARVTAARADFQGANRFGRLAADAGDKAAEEAVLAEKDPSRRPIDVKSLPLPAKDGGTEDDTNAPKGKGAIAPAKE